MQIRVHLHCAGHPIANDMLYLSEDVPSRSASGVGADRAASGACKPPMSNSHKVDSFAEDSASEEFSIDPMCTNCPNLPPKGYGMMKMRRVYGFIVSGIQDLVGVTNALILIGLISAD
ncbi:hypothetical protein B296_00040198 [Ensete ventricosum]|uniref:Uncharacterized protein n=1 Tax=Ensete ventricosum TaxID=4639 RepID=A0A426ZR15_ENSVE|nr:hypothetical protein B296_00040198 [Ensete ventricosum]